MPDPEVVAPPPPEPEPSPYRVGTLLYTPGGLLFVCFWVLWGGLCYNTMAYNVVPNVLPVTLNRLSLSQEAIGVIAISIPQLMNLFMSPVVSTWSDRLRTRWGRRRPFLLLATPPVALFLAVVGWAPEIAAWAARTPTGVDFSKWLSATSWGGELGPNPLGILVVCASAVLFQFFSQIVGLVFCYIYADVVPRKFMGRFMASMQIFTALGGVAFNKLLMPMVDREGQVGWVYTIVAGIYFLSFMGMGLMVKEGRYPPPEQYSGAAEPLLARVGKQVGVYFRQCFSVPFYLMLFVGTALTQVSTACRGAFNVLFATKELGLTTEQFGEVATWGGGAAVAVLFLGGYLMDRLHPLLIYIASNALVLGLNAYGYYRVVDYDTFFAVGVAIVVVYSVQGMCVIPMFARLFPRDKYGQFSSGNGIVNCLLMVLAGWLGGKAIGHFGYRFLFVWDFAFTVLASGILVWVYRRYLALGGAQGFVPPERHVETVPAPEPPPSA